MDPKAMFKLTYGLYLLSARENGRDNACIVNTALQVANEPTRVSVAVIKKNLTCDMILNTGVFNVSTIDTRADFGLFRRFGMRTGRETDKFDGFTSVERSANGLYYLTACCNGYLSAKVTDKYDLGTHILFIAEVTDGAVLGNDPSVTYGYYQSDIKPKPARKKGWVCSVCGYVYEGDELPDDFICPVCKHGRDDFVRADAAPAAPAPAVETKISGGKKWVCPVCGYVHEGDVPPAECPLCHVSGDKFTLQEEDFVWACEHVIGIAKDAPADIVEGLRANFTGECTEVGMYLAMSRAAAREGYPEIAKYWKTAAFEEAEHAAKFAELLGEVVSESTKQNLTVRVAAENGAAEGKFALAQKARGPGLDAIADTVMEMAKDEARHGKAFRGMLERYFGK